MKKQQAIAISICFLLAAAVQAQDVAVPGTVAVSPGTIEIRHQRQPHAIQVLAATAEGYSLDLRTQAKFSSSDAKIATVDADGWVRPVANGQAQVTVTVAGVTKMVAVKVQLPETEPPI